MLHSEVMNPLASFWSGLGGDPALLTRVSAVERPAVLPSHLPVRETARACVGVCALAAAELTALRTGGEVPAVRVDDGAVATAFVSERHLRIDGRAPENFAPLSRFWRTADGWVRTHANYPHHRARLLAALGTGDDPDAVAAALAGRSAYEVEDTVTAAGGLAVALRTPEEWAAHEQAVAVARHPLVEREQLDTAPAREFTPSGGRGGPLLPAAGLRVLDLTRVLAGPVATRTLALLGADVLRLDAPGLPELPDQHADTGFGKRSALLDLAAGRDTFEELLARADVVVTGYRPGALDRFGLSPRALAERRPGVVVAQVSAWGPPGRGRGGGASTAWCRWPRGSPGSRARRTGRARCPHRPSTTARATCSRPASCVPSPNRRRPAAADGYGWPWHARRANCWRRPPSPRTAVKASRCPTTTARRPPPAGWRNGTVLWAGSATSSPAALRGRPTQLATPTGRVGNGPGTLVSARRSRASAAHARRRVRAGRVGASREPAAHCGQPVGRERPHRRTALPNEGAGQGRRRHAPREPGRGARAGRRRTRARRAPLTAVGRGDVAAGAPPGRVCGGGSPRVSARRSGRGGGVRGWRGRRSSEGTSFVFRAALAPLCVIL